MREKILISLIVLFGLTTSLVYAAPPEMRPAAPDVQNSGDMNDYTPGVVNQKSTTTQNGFQNDDFDDTEVDLPDEDYNPINSDGTEENLKNEVFTPVKDKTEEVKNSAKEAIETVKENVKQDKKEKKEKQKKEKDPYKGYNDAANDEYIKSLDKDVTSEAPAAQKTYSQDDYEQAYRDLPVPDFSFVHGIDPDQYYDMKDTMWSPYPLLRLNSPLYFKSITIEPGYYLLTPREYKGDWYLLFKESGKVKYTIPVFAKDFTPESYYRDNLPELDMKKSQRWQIKFLNAWGKYVKSSKRKPAISCNIELTDLDNNFLLIELYYGSHKYSTIYRVEKF